MNRGSVISLLWAFTVLLVCLKSQLILAKARDLCQVKPSTSSLCGPTTLGIYYDADTQLCHVMGCSKKRLFGSVAECERICNNPRHVKIRNQLANKANHTTD